MKRQAVLELLGEGGKGRCMPGFSRTNDSAKLQEEVGKKICA